MLYKFPTNIKLWDEYSQIRAESFQAGGNASEGTAYYAEYREAMDVGIFGWSMVKSIEKGARQSAEMGGHLVINNSV
jgi:hypothetical protein